MTETRVVASIREALLERFGENISVDANLPGLDELARIAGHRTHRRYSDKVIEPSLLRLLCAPALSAPSKSDLQHFHFRLVVDNGTRRSLGQLMPVFARIFTCPLFLAVLANRQALNR